MDESERRLLAIWIGPYEAENIALNLREIKVSRPVTYGLMADLLDQSGRADRIGGGISAGE